MLGTTLRSPCWHPDQVLSSQVRLAAPAVRGEKADICDAEVETRGARVIYARFPAHPIVAKQNGRFVAIEKVCGRGLIRQVHLPPLHAQRGGSECGRVRLPPPQARLVTYVAVLIAKRAALREGDLRPLQQHLRRAESCAASVVDLVQAALGESPFVVETVGECLLRRGVPAGMDHPQAAEVEPERKRRKPSDRLGVGTRAVTDLAQEGVVLGVVLRRAWTQE